MRCPHDGAPLRVGRVADDGSGDILHECTRDRCSYETAWRTEIGAFEAPRNPATWPPERRAAWRPPLCRPEDSPAEDGGGSGHPRVDDDGHEDDRDEEHRDHHAEAQAREVDSGGGDGRPRDGHARASRSSAPNHRAPVLSAQRFHGENSCPICGGADDDRRGAGVRCWGFRSLDEQWAYCTREQFSGALSPNSNGTYAHRLVSTCRCGASHDRDAEDLRRRTREGFERERARHSGTSHEARDSTDTQTNEMHQPAKSLGVTRYQIKDERGEVVAVHARENIADSDKQIWWERPDESLGLGGIKVADLPLFGVEYLAATTTDTPVIVTEGEPKQPVLSEHGFVAVGTVTGAKATPSDETLRPLLRFERVILWPDHDDDGRGHMSRIGERLRTLGHRDVRVLVWPEARDEGDDAVDFFARGGTAEQVVAMIAAAQSAFDESRLSASPWHRARLIGEFLADGDANSNWLDEPLLMRGAITHIFAPRGVGKSLICIAKAVDLSRAGLRVLYLDRDNSPSVIKKRFRAFGAGAHLAGLRVMTRTEVPPLTDTQAWANFPYQEYDLVIVDSLDAATEGVGEQDSAKVSRAIASILDIARRVGGPAFLIPGNTVKSGAHSRGSGVIEDRADIVFEVRDVTEFRPTGQKPWWEELPPAGRSAWAERATRRMGRMRYRLAFIGTKTRGDEEPEPFILEVDLSGNPYTIREVTATVTGAGDRAQREARARLDQGAGALRQEIERRAQTGEESMLADHDGVPFLQARGLTQKAARDLIADRAGAQWLVVERDGRSKILAPLSGQEASTAGDVTTPSGACIQTSADSATESANPREYSGCEAPNTVERMDTGQRNSGAQNPAPDAGIGIPWPISPYGPSTAPPPPAAVVTTKVSKEPPAPKPSRDEAEADLGDELPPWTAWLQGEKLDKAKARLNRAQAAWERNMGSADARRELDSAYAVFWPIKNAAASEPSLPVKTALITGASSATPEANRPLALGRLPKRQPVPPPEQATPEVTLGRVSKKQPVPPEPGRSDAGQP